MIAYLPFLAVLVTAPHVQPAAVAADVPSAAAPRASRVDLRLVRIAGRTGTLLVSSAIPLPPGALRSADRGLVRVLVDGREQAAYVEPLQGTHLDGSLRSVLVQFRAAVPASGRAPAVLEIGTRSTVPRLPRAAHDRGRPAAVALPASADYLVSTLFVGPTRTVQAAARLTPAIRRHDESFVTFAERHWTRDGADWGKGNYYDRAYIYYAAWVRTANPEYWRRGTEMALDYRRRYLEANEYKASAHWAMLEGVAAHYELTGDDSSRIAIGRVADQMAAPYYVANLQDPAAEMDNRMQARVLLSFVLAHSLRAPSQENHNWDERARDALTKILASQAPDGAYRKKQVNQCNQNKPFMVGLTNAAFIRYHERFAPDRRILPAVKKSLDYMWRKDWRPRERAFVYLGGPCNGEGVGVSPDLNNLLITGYAWYAAQSGDDAYRSRADQIFEGAAAGSWLDGSKQFNQQYLAAHNYIGYRPSR